jgi:hypothetical protein
MRAVLGSSLIVPLLLAATVSAKGVTSRITVRDMSLRTSIEITDPAVLEGFNVWAGPGTFVNGVEGTEGFIIDWASGPVSTRPSDLRRYEVLFFVGPSNTAGAQASYVVVYEIDPSSGRGFVYLPGKSDPHYSLNTRAILRGHGFEGRWFRATAAWQNAVGKSVPTHTRR